MYSFCHEAHAHQRYILLPLRIKLFFFITFPVLLYVYFCPFFSFMAQNLRSDLVLIVDTFGKQLFEELDYQQEARNAARS